MTAHRDQDARKGAGSTGLEARSPHTQTHAGQVCGKASAMTPLIWHPIREVRLREALVPDPVGTGKLDVITGGRLAVADGVLYIDPRDGLPDPEIEPYTVTGIPLGGVISFSIEIQGIHADEGPRHQAR